MHKLIWRFSPFSLETFSFVSQLVLRFGELAPFNSAVLRWRLSITSCQLGMVPTEVLSKAHGTLSDVDHLFESDSPCQSAAVALGVTLNDKKDSKKEVNVRKNLRKKHIPPPQKNKKTSHIQPHFVTVH